MSQFARVAQSYMRDSRAEGTRLARIVGRARLALSPNEILVPRKIQEDSAAVLAHCFLIVAARSCSFCGRQLLTVLFLHPSFHTNHEEHVVVLLPACGHPGRTDGLH